MKCRIHPDFISFLQKVLLCAILIPIGILTIALILYGISFVGGTIVQAIDSPWLFNLLIDTDTVYPSADVFWMIMGGKFAFLLLIVLFVTSLMVVPLIIAWEETAESIRYRRYRLECLFEGKKAPWYRILLSYIIVCEKTKDL